MAPNGKNNEGVSSEIYTNSLMNGKRKKVAYRGKIPASATYTIFGNHTN